MPSAADMIDAHNAAQTDTSRDAENQPKDAQWGDDLWDKDRLMAWESTPAYKSSMKAMRTKKRGDSVARAVRGSVAARATRGSVATHVAVDASAGPSDNEDEPFTPSIVSCEESVPVETINIIHDTGDWSGSDDDLDDTEHFKFSPDQKALALSKMGIGPEELDTLACQLNRMILDRHREARAVIFQAWRSFLARTRVYQLSLRILSDEAYNSLVSDACHPVHACMLVSMARAKSGGSSAKLIATNFDKLDQTIVSATLVLQRARRCKLARAALTQRALKKSTPIPAEAPPSARARGKAAEMSRFTNQLGSVVGNRDNRNRNNRGNRNRNNRNNRGNRDERTQLSFVRVNGDLCFAVVPANNNLLTTFSWFDCCGFWRHGTCRNAFDDPAMRNKSYKAKQQVATTGVKDPTMTEQRVRTEEFPIMRREGNRFVTTGRHGRPTVPAGIVAVHSLCRACAPPTTKRANKT
jgi:hypothetical protein